MDASKYRDLTTSRGIKYHYYFTPPQDGKPTLLFSHGFPSSSYDWHKQVSFFEPLGYGLVVPDQLGYGGTDKPLDVEAYRPSLITKDLVEILDAENASKVIAIGHDWGAKVTSRLANYFPERFIGFGFITVSYKQPDPDYDLQTLLRATKKAYGYELFGYMSFLAEDGAAKIFEDHFDSAWSLIFPEDSTIWKTDMAPLDGMKSWMLANKKTPTGSYLSKEEENIMRDALRTSGLEAPVHWYKIMASGVAADDDKYIPLGRANLTKPVFFGACLRDYICLAEPGKAAITKYAEDHVIREYDADHWVMLSHAVQLNADLLEWVDGVASKRAAL